MWRPTRLNSVCTKGTPVAITVQKFANSISLGLHTTHVLDLPQPRRFLLWCCWFSDGGRTKTKMASLTPFHVLICLCVCVGKFAWILLLLLLFLSQQAAGGGGCQRLSRAERPSLHHPKQKGGSKSKPVPMIHCIRQSVGRSFGLVAFLDVRDILRQLGRKKKTNQTDTDLWRESAYCVLFLLLRTTLRVELASAVGLGLVVGLFLCKLIKCSPVVGLLCCSAAAARVQGLFASSLTWVV